MPDREITPEARLAVASAFAFAGPMGANEGQWRNRFNEGILRAAAAMNGRAAWDAQDMLDADIFTGTYNGYDVEESSTRLIVKIVSDTGRAKDKDADGNERIRTDRTDNASGARMRSRLDKLTVGSRIIAWKVLEKMAKSEDDQKVRIMKHFEVLQFNKDSTSSTAAPTAAPSSATGGVTPSPPVAVSSGDHDNKTYEMIAARLGALDTKRTLAFVNKCREKGLNFVNPPAEDLDQVLVYLAEAEETHE